MKKELLNALKGLAVNDATAKVAEAGLKALVAPLGSMMTMQVKPNTVILWEQDGKVDSAVSGGDELE